MLRITFPKSLLRYLCLGLTLLGLEVSAARAEWVKTGEKDTRSVVSLASSANYLYAGTYESVSRSIDSGNTWTDAHIDMPSSFDNVDALLASDTTLFAGTNGEGVYSTSDHGNTWIMPGGGTVLSSVLSLARIDAYLFAGTYEGVYCLPDGAKAWIAVNNGMWALKVFSLLAIGTKLFGATGDSGVYSSDDYGKTWTRSGLHQVAFSLVSKESFVLAGTSAGVFRTSDSGKTWTVANKGLPDKLVLAFAVFGANIFAGTYGGGVYRSADNGASWTPFNEGLTPGKILSFAISSSNLFAGTDSNGVWRFPLSQIPSSIVLSGKYQMKTDFVRIIGSVIRPGTDISFSIGRPSEAELSVFDGAGNRVETWNASFSTAGTYLAHFNGCYLSRGIYYLRLRAGGIVHSRIMILEKP